MDERLPSPDAIKAHVAGRLRLRRSSMGITQEELASRSGLSVTQIGKYERGVDRISADRLYHFSLLLKCTPSHFFQAIPIGDQVPAEDQVPEVEIDRDRLEMLRQYERCPPYVQRGIRANIRHCARGRPRPPTSKGGKAA